MFLIMLEREVYYYEKNKRKFKELYNGKYIVIKNKAIIGIYDTHSEAYHNTITDNEVGTFIIKHIVKR